MTRRLHGAIPLVALLFLAAGAAMVPTAVTGGEILYDGGFTLKPNGDMAVVIKLTLPMMQYQRLRDSVSNLYLMLRDLASSRADTEVVEKKADWDDANRTITFSMTVQGAAKNLGNRWEIPVAKGAIFTTFNEKERTFYFSEAGSGPMGPVRGTTKGVLPEGATEAKWDEARRVVSYVMPAPRAAGASQGGLLIPGAVVAAVGLVLFLGSFLAGPKRAPAVAWQQAPPPPPASGQ
ncbi:MAG TPA: hypothetical protein PLE19_14695 [Planctomycetota bacterium]|nr:hypothetical protein [Planctomycetota bacterium]HRR79363.1 hypothetical protein [Planctomycetota bacterium]HRT97181.1 hypothetical protein [Planctomycetota bacterium]